MSPLLQDPDEPSLELASPPQSARALAEQARRLRPLLLVVDDDKFVHKLMARVLGAAHYDVLCVASATKAIRLLRERRPDLILMDIGLPGVDGIQFTRQLKAAVPLAAIPVIMLSGQSGRQVIIDSLSVGAVDFIVKPVDRDILLKKVARWLAR